MSHVHKSFLKWFHLLKGTEYPGNKHTVVRELWPTLGYLEILIQGKLLDTWNWVSETLDYSFLGQTSHILVSPVDFSIYTNVIPLNLLNYDPRRSLFWHDYLTFFSIFIGVYHRLCIQNLAGYRHLVWNPRPVHKGKVLSYCVWPLNGF